MGLEELQGQNLVCLELGLGPAAGAGQAVGCVAWLGCFTSGTFGWSGGFAVAGSPAALLNDAQDS